MSLYFIEATAFIKLFVREAGTDHLIGLLEPLDDHRKLISSLTPIEIYAAIRKSERAGKIAAEAAASALEALQIESARVVQQPVNPGVLESARQLLDRTSLRWPDALQLGTAMTARDMFAGTSVVVVSALPHLLLAAKNEGLQVIDPAALPIEASLGSDDVELAS